MAGWFKRKSLKKFLQCYGPKPVQYEPTFGICASSDHFGLMGL